VKKKADDLNGTSGGWPYPPTKEMVDLLREEMTAEWGRMKRKYEAFKVDDLALDAKKGKNPEVTATLKYDGEWKGGKSVMLKVGDTVTSLAKSEYGFECYAAAIWDANDATLGSQCKVLPAGFGLELPKLWVPKWMTEPKVKVPGGAGSKAQEVSGLPPISVSYGTKAKSTHLVPVGPVIVEITLTVAGEVKVSHAGVIDAAFDAKEQTAAISKALGPLTGELSLDCQSKKGDASLSLTVFKKEYAGLTFSGSVKLASGGLSLSLGVATVKIVEGDITIAGSFKAKADLKVYPNSHPDEAKADEYEASVGVVIAGAIILAPLAIRVVGAVPAREVGKAAVAKLAEFAKLAPSLQPAM
jgi:phage tail protein X